jgi:hypothetical protein
MDRDKKVKEIEKECKICGKRLYNDWIKCYDLYFCSMEHINKFEKGLHR